MNAKEMKDGLEEFFFKEAGSKELINEKGGILCRRCNEVLMSPKDAREFIEIARQQWVDEGYWDKIYCMAVTRRWIVQSVAQSTFPPLSSGNM
jgi:Fe-S oxidoreductase